MQTSKRILDFVVSAFLLAGGVPVLVIVAILVKMNMGSPILFRQPRPGLNGKVFTMIKFRSMRDAIDKDGAPLPDADRLTAFGKFLRKSSLDELPELWNVLKGEMSLVGPRPLLVEYLPLYTAQQAKRHDVRPGITGWTQVNGRNALDWEQKFEYDVWYVENQSFSLDIKILWMTFVGLFKPTGISSADHATMPKFDKERQ